jgi:hypothetical protein
MFGPDGALLGQGVGSASTMEGKYRYRKEYSPNGDKTDSYGKKYRRIENEDIADVYNTVLKIAKKRAHIDATLTVTGAADIFSQDLIDEDDETPARKPVEMPVEKPAPKAEPRNEQQGGEIVTVTVGEIKSKKGGTEDKPWTRFDFKDGDQWYSTFSETLANELSALSGQEAELRIERTDKGNTVLAIVSDAAES